MKKFGTICLAVSMLMNVGMADERKDTLVYADPAQAQRLNAPHHGRYYIYFCAVCPSAKKMMHSSVKALSELNAKSQAPLELVLISDKLDAEGVAKYAKSAGIVNAIAAEDPKNSLNIGLQNIYQFRFIPGGKDSTGRESFASPDAVMGMLKGDLSSIGVYAYPKDGIEDPKLKKLWWDLETNQPKALASLAKLAKFAKPGKGNGDQVLKLHEVADANVTAAVDRAMEKELSLPMVEELEAALAQAKGFKTFKEATAKLKSSLRDKGIKEELKVKKYYLQATKLLGSGKKKEREKGAATLAAIAKKWPDTHYGKKAASVGNVSKRARDALR